MNILSAVQSVISAFNLADYYIYFVLAQTVAILLFVLFYVIHSSKKDKKAVEPTSESASATEETAVAEQVEDETQAESQADAPVFDASKRIEIDPIQVGYMERAARAEVAYADALERELAALRALADLTTQRVRVDDETPVSDKIHIRKVTTDRLHVVDGEGYVVEEVVEEPIAVVDDQAPVQEIDEAAIAEAMTKTNDEDSEVLSYEIDKSTATITRTVLYRKKSYVAKMCQADETVKIFYEELSNYLQSFKKVKSRISNACDSFRFGMKYLAKITIKGKTLCMYLALNPAEFEDSKYHFTDVSAKKKYEDTPMMLKIRSNRALKYAKELIDTMMQQNEAVANPTYEAQAIAKLYPAKTNAQLVKEGEIKENYYEEVCDLEGKRISIKKKD